MSMKKIRVLLSFTLITFGLLFVTGCATGFPNGVIYTNVKIPVSVSEDYSSKQAIKTGEAECWKWFGCWVDGDMSIDKAMKNCKSGEIKRIKMVEYQSHDILGTGWFKIVVYGE